MYSLLVLGIIPGTNIAISFQAWLGVAMLIAAVATYPRLEKYRSLQPHRVVLHATQLHRRVQ